MGPFLFVNLEFWRTYSLQLCNCSCK